LPAGTGKFNARHFAHHYLPTIRPGGTQSGDVERPPRAATALPRVSLVGNACQMRDDNKETGRSRLARPRIHSRQVNSQPGSVPADDRKRFASHTDSRVPRPGQLRGTECRRGEYRSGELGFGTGWASRQPSRDAGDVASAIRLGSGPIKIRYLGTRSVYLDIISGRMNSLYHRSLKFSIPPVLAITYVVG
jgi:hypothetical protein